MSEDDKQEFYDFFATPISYDVGLPHTGMLELCERRMDLKEWTEYNYLIKNDFKYRLHIDGLPSATVVSKNLEKHTQVL